MPRLLANHAAAGWECKMYNENEIFLGVQGQFQSENRLAHAYLEYKQPVTAGDIALVKAFVDKYDVLTPEDKERIRPIITEIAGRL